MNLPLVSIGIPTYNRALLLKQAIESVINQDYQNVEIIVSDNGSLDETEAICLSYANKSEQFRYIRHPNNLGPQENFREVLRNASGRFFMWLGDDDWIDPSYISTCIHQLISNPAMALVSGTPKYYSKGKKLYDGRVFNLLHDSRWQRVISYYNQVSDNGMFYGIMPTALIRQIEIPRKMGADWIMIASIAFFGKIKMMDCASIHREIGATVSFQEIGVQFSVPQFERDYPYITIAIFAFRDISCKSPIYKSMGRVSRYSVAICVFLVIVYQHILYRGGRAILSRLVKLILGYNPKLWMRE